MATTYTVSTISELNTAINAVQPGDIIEMEDGTWTDASIIFDANGTATSPIVLRAKNAGQVLLTGETELRIGGDYLIVSGLRFEDCTTDQSNLIAFRRNSSDLANHSRLTDCVIKDCNPTDPTENYKWIGIYGTHNEVDHCYIENKTHEGACVVVWSNADAAFHHIHHNYFGPSPEGDGNGWETIRIGTSSWAQYAGHNLVEHNYFYKRDGEIEIISGKSSFSTYRYNIFRECKGGLTLRHGTDCSVEGNLFFGENKSGTYGVRLIDRNHKVINNYFEGLNGASSGLRYPICLMGGQVNNPANGYQPNINNTIAFNTVVNCTKGIMIGAESSQWTIPPDSCTFSNNVVSITNQVPVVHELTPTNTTYIGNYFYRSDGSVSVPTSGYVDVDPQFQIVSGDSLYRPLTTSPLISAAVTGWSEESLDFESQNRSGQPTVGADELSSDPVIERGIYGPTWLTDNETTTTTSVLLEAEDATLGANWTVESDALACSSQYMLPPNMSSTSTTPTGTDDLLTFSFSIGVSGEYKIYARTATTSVHDDSFWVRANGGAWQRWNAINGPDYPAGYNWSQVGNWTSGTTADPVTFTLNEGMNTVDFSWREEEARLDKIFVTNEDLSILGLVRNNTINEQFSLRYTIENACPLDTIHFDVATDDVDFPFDENVIEIDIPLAIIGNSTSNTVFNGMSMHTFFINNSNNLYFKGLKLTNAYATTDGGALLNHGVLKLSDVIFENNYESSTPKALTNYGELLIETAGTVHIKQ